MGEIWQVPGYGDLRKLGLTGFDPEKRSSVHLFDLELVPDFFPDIKGRLACQMSEGRNFLRRAETNIFEVVTIHEDGILDASMPGWNSLDLSWGQLKVLPEKWKAKLREWRAIYYIFDTDIKQGYVGSASGEANLLGRWLDYAATGHGDNSKLRNRSPANFRFTILERVSPDMDKREIDDLERLWKLRLHTREHGLNNN